MTTMAPEVILSKIVRDAGTGLCALVDLETDEALLLDESYARCSELQYLLQWPEGSVRGATAQDVFERTEMQEVADAIRKRRRARGRR